VERPLLFLDVDGVLLPVGPGRPPGYEPARAGPFPVFVSPALRAAAPALVDAFDVHWVTSWNHDANVEVGPLFGLPHLPVLELPGHYGKLEAVRTFAPDHRRMAWAEDRLEPEAWAWAEGRPSGTLLVAPDRRRGLEPEHVEELLAFAAAA
jgi:hypothetical protein